MEWKYEEGGLAIDAGLFFFWIIQLTLETEWHIIITTGLPATSHESDVPHGETFFYIEKRKAIAVKEANNI